MNRDILEQIKEIKSILGIHLLTILQSNKKDRQQILLLLDLSFLFALNGFDSIVD